LLFFSSAVLAPIYHGLPAFRLFLNSLALELLPSRM
jgi:hypothetical protein